MRIINVALITLTLLLSPLSAIAAQVVDINRADAATMIENWKGIGEKKARAIVSYRKKNGRFSSIDELANVKGVGEGLIKNNRRYMSVSKGVFKATGKKSTTSKEKSTTKDKTAKKDSKQTKSSDKKADKKSTTSSKSSKSKSANSTKKKSKKDCKPGSKDKKCAKKPTKKKSTKKSTKKKKKTAS